jgi:hypothetical protein
LFETPFPSGVPREKYWEMKDQETEEAMQYSQREKLSVLEKHLSIERKLT